MKRFLASVLFLFITVSCFSQDFDSYKYVVIPYEFNFLNKHDKYRVNTLVRHLFKKEGFHVVYDNQPFPKDLADNRCLGMYADINNQSGLFTVKMSIVLRDCSNQIFFETAIGRSKIKAYEKGYNQALRRAFADIEAKNYSYKPVVKTVVETPSVEVIELEEVEEVEEVEVEEVVEQEMTTTTTKTPVLYAQPIKNGYQLVDSTPKVVMILLKTGAPNVYIVKGRDASVYKENGKWLLSKITSEGNDITVLNIKF
ncbi:hypothetical protein H2O64_14025 [Kordia sp. YSTF-M3]|uniref:Secreted protein n=1 Tax=Kordia aestuariivivens TaxID=2759037 RepID=A0ABR7QB43_9FLAO|nr:hypothetical protein [Kordia aestuariivivens]MBC8755790.1 hypothetical protein [Kordia aestuariivivens]